MFYKLFNTFFVNILFSGSKMNNWVTVKTKYTKEVWCNYPVNFY